MIKKLQLLFFLFFIVLYASISKEDLIIRGSSNLIIFMSEKDCDIYVNYLHPFINSIKEFNIQCFIVVSANALPNNQFYNNLKEKYSYVDIIYDKYNIVSDKYNIYESPRYILIDTSGQRVAEAHVGKKNIDFKYLISAGKRKKVISVKPIKQIIIHTDESSIQSNHFPRDVVYCETNFTYFVRNNHRENFYIVDSTGLVIENVANKNHFTDIRASNYGFGWFDKCKILYMTGADYSYKSKKISLTKYNIENKQFLDSIDIDNLQNNNTYGNFNKVFYDRYTKSYFQTIQLDRSLGSINFKDEMNMYMMYDSNGNFKKAFGQFSDRYLKYKLSFWNLPELMFNKESIISKQNLDRELIFYSHEGEYIKTIELETPNFYRIFNFDYKHSREPEYTRWLNTHITRSRSFISNSDGTLFAEILQNNIFDENNKETREKYLVFYDSNGKIINKNPYKFPYGFYIHCIEGDKILTSHYNSKFQLVLEWYKIKDFYDI